MPYSPSAIWTLIQLPKQHHHMYNRRLHIYFIQHKNDAIYTTLNTQERSIYRVPWEHQNTSWVYAEIATVSLLVTGEQPVRTLESSVMPYYTWQHVVSVQLWNTVWIVICNIFSTYTSRETSWQFWRRGNLSAVLCKSIYRRMTNFRITGAATRESCCAQWTGQLNLFTKKDYHKFLGLAYHLHIAKQSMDKCNHFYKYNSKSHLTKESRLCLTISLEYNLVP